MENFQGIIVVFTILLALLAIADKLRLPNPVLLVVAGLGISFLPGIPTFQLNPEVIFLVFLPPILFDAASNTSWHDFKTEIKPISVLAIALVIFTSLAVATTSYFLIPGFTIPMAFVLGAIVSPPDAVAATNITKGLGLNRRVITIIEGESLVNDASALITYRFAITAIGTGSFIFWKAGIDFVMLVGGGILSGIVIGYLFIEIHKRILNNSIISTSLTLLTPFVAYSISEQLHVSGVLAVVSAGLVISWRAPDIFSHHTRLRNKAVWDTIIFLLNGFIFILIGLQLPAILADLTNYTARELIFFGFAISAVTILARITWVFSAAYLTAGIFSKTKGDITKTTWKNVSIVAWTGTRGVVSLATALALPLTMSGGSQFPQRSLILFIAFVVIFVTLVVQGLSLPLLVKVLKIKPARHSGAEEKDLRMLMASGALNFIETEMPLLDDAIKSEIKRPYLESINILSVIDESESNNFESLLRMKLLILAFERQLIISYHKEGTFNQSAIRRLERELDTKELQLNRTLRKIKQTNLNVHRNNH
jgi:CPA1 family monovalent cation:H+ antiporter